jgi:hypothetical protein
VVQGSALYYSLAALIALMAVGIFFGIVPVLGRAKKMLAK